MDGDLLQSDRSIGVQWIGIMVTIFAMVIFKLYVLPIIKNYLVPNLLQNVPASDTTAYNGLQAVYTFMSNVPYVIVFICFLYAFVLIFWKEQVDVQY